MKTVEGRERHQLLAMADHHAHTIHLWLRKCGLSPEERKKFWLDEAEKEDGPFDYMAGVQPRPRHPVTLLVETGKGLGYTPGRVTWHRKYGIDFESSSFPFDFPVNSKQLADFAKLGYSVIINRDGTGFTYSTEERERAPDKVIEDLEDVFHFIVAENGAERKEKNGQ